jgi:hypothetical protein
MDQPEQVEDVDQADELVDETNTPTRLVPVRLEKLLRGLGQSR